jgi:hypothetical protein
MALEGENAKLKRLVAEQLLVIEGLKEFSGKKELPGGSSRSCGAVHAPGCIATRGLPVPGIEPASGPRRLRQPQKDQTPCPD